MENDRIKFYFNYVVSAALPVENRKERMRAISYDLLVDVPKEKYLINQCIDNDIFEILFGCNNLNDIQIRKDVATCLDKMCNIMCFRENEAINIIALFLECIDVSISVESMNYNIGNKEQIYMNGFFYREEYQAITDTILNRFPEYRIANMLSIDIGYYALVNGDYIFENGEFNWLLDKCMQSIKRISFLQDGSVSEYRTIINTYVDAQLLFMNGSLGACFKKLIEFNSYVKSHKPAVKRDARLFFLWINSRMFIHVIKNMLGVKDSDFVDKHKAVYNMISKKQVSDTEIWYDVNNISYFPVFRIVGDPRQNSIFDDATRWGLGNRLEWTLKDGKVSFSKIGLHEGITNVSIELKCSNEELLDIKSHLWDDVREVYGDFIDIIINSNVPSYSLD